MGQQTDDGNPPVIHPYSGRLDPVELGPVRVAGWQRARDGSARPVIQGAGSGRDDVLRGRRHVCRRRVEVPPEVGVDGVDQRDSGSPTPHRIRRVVERPRPRPAQLRVPALVAHIQRASKSTTIGPEPELVSAVWDDDAFREYFAEHHHMAALPGSGSASRPRGGLLQRGDLTSQPSRVRPVDGRRVSHVPSSSSSVGLSRPSRFGAAVRRVSAALSARSA